LSEQALNVILAKDVPNENRADSKEPARFSQGQETLFVFGRGVVRGIDV